MSQSQKQAKIFKALMHPARLEILKVIRGDEECVCHMKAVLGYRQAYISQQLSILKDAGIIEDRRDGRNVFYQVSSPQVYDLLDLAMSLAGENESQPVRHHRQIKCPCPKCSPETETAKV